MTYKEYLAGKQTTFPPAIMMCLQSFFKKCIITELVN